MLSRFPCRILPTDSKTKAVMAHNGKQPNRLALLTGFGIGGLWVVSALFCLYSAYRGFADHRPDYGMSWSLAGTLLLGAGG
ncbi:MAG TPA: hypothetical protein VK864_09075, partial [Longimicrobiales bacterium]|nr:hypothetical protein [Longimicrobiales bacterium]